MGAADLLVGLGILLDEGGAGGCGVHAHNGFAVVGDAGHEARDGGPVAGEIHLCGAEAGLDGAALAVVERDEEAVVRCGPLGVEEGGLLVGHRAVGVALDAGVEADRGLHVGAERRGPAEIEVVGAHRGVVVEDRVDLRRIVAESIQIVVVLLTR